MTKHPILEKPITELATSDEFLAMAEKNHFNTLEDIVKIPTYDLLKLPLFGFRIYKELISILKAYKLESELIED
jgi:DNA-directed RNA polymerase alpha subunit